jgi:signal transduction histidine kinase
MFSGIRTDDGRLLLFHEARLQDTKNELDLITIRRQEILRHLPLVVAQFDSAGRIMEQNPESMDVFGGSVSDGPSFMDRFADPGLGTKTLTKILESENNHHVDAQLHTAHQGPRWFAIQVRRSKDPVTAEVVVLYSARDITEFRQAKKEADEAAMEKSEFLAVMAHEIRTPLHQVIGYIELLGQSQLSSQQEEFVRTMESSSTCLMTIINDLLDFTKLEAGKMKLETIVFEVKDVVAGSLTAISPKAEEKGLQLVPNVSGDVPAQAIGDPTRLRQLLLNLLSNAVKFTDQGEISLHVKRLENDSSGRLILLFEVRDSGIGISADHLKLIFSKYQQAEASITRKYGGTGLGLAICKQMAVAMGGLVGVESTLGQGSVFWLQLPFEQVSKSSSPSPGLELQLSPCMRGLHVLVAEDNIVNQKLAVHLLKRLGHTSKIAFNGLEALEELKRNRSSYDMVLMDVQMPVMVRLLRAC